MKVKIFVGYTHHDGKYLNDDSLLGHVRGLEHAGVAEFWWDEKITTGDLWDDEIQRKIAESQIALLLVSELFLNSHYIRNTEIPLFLKKRREEGMIIVPVILSACDWQAHDWLKGTQFLPKDGKNIESHYCDPGSQKELFLQIKRDLRLQIDRIRRETPFPSAESVSKSAPVETAPSIDVGPEGGEWENPFDLVTANDLHHEDIPQLFVGEYTPFNTITKHFDTILEGQRGTGKTMILRYMEFETKMKIWTDRKKQAAPAFFQDRSNFIGVYCRLEQGVFDRSDLDVVESGDRKDRLFEHRLSLFCLSHALKTLRSILIFMSINSQVLQSLKQRLSVLLGEPQLNTCLDWVETYNYAQQTIDLRVAEGDLHLGSILPGGTPTSFNPWLTMSSQIVPFLEFLQGILDFRCPFFFMLDDFDVLRPSQQSAIFRTASARRLGVVCFKYGIMTLGKKAILSGSERTYREGHDYDLVPLDWTDKGLQTDYKKAIELITAKRLEAKSWPPGTRFGSMLAPWKRGEELREEVKLAMQSEWERLPSKKKPKTFQNYWSKYGNARYFQHLANKKIHHRYAGYEIVIDISSGIYRQYLEICNQIVAKALASGWRPNLENAMSAEIQDDAIRAYSRAMMDSLSVTAGDTTALLSGKINVTSRHMVTFIESLSQLFRTRLHSDIREPEIFCISIRDNLERNSVAKAILEVAVRESILHRRSEDYPPKTAGGPSLPTYMLNRRLAPRSGLGVRMQGRIEILSSDIVLAAEDTANFIRKVSKEHGKKSSLDLFRRE